MNNSLYKLTILVVFFNGRREAERTLHSLTTKYQLDAVPGSYKVMVLDSGSTEPLDPERIKSFGKYFEYHYVETNYPSPAEALQKGLTFVDTPYVGISIDGARMLSPGIINGFFEILKIDKNPFVYTPRYYLGKYVQMDSVKRGYKKETEDLLLNSVNWKENGYHLFKISSIEQSEEYEYDALGESNLFFCSTKELRESEQLDKPYYSLGGGLMNLDCFLFFTSHKHIKTYCLVGEATFHQIHGGVVSNAKREESKLPQYRKEFFKINNSTYHRITYDVNFYGHYNSITMSYLPKKGSETINTFIEGCDLTESEKIALDKFRNKT